MNNDKPYLEFYVAPYALVDALKGIELSKEDNQNYEFVVTKEDGNLLVRVFMSYNVVANTECGKTF